ncbi:hypothetical protein CKO36_10080 [Rhabdochromatium marinum]|nr:hypothetical protein [Rhabdochromatium marinum]
MPHLWQQRPSLQPLNIRRWLGLILLAALAILTLSGCSRVQIAYNTAEFTIELYADRYLGLDDRQVAIWRPVLASALDQHRQDELPALSALLTQAAGDVKVGLTADKVSAWMDQIEPLYQRHARLFAATTAPLLATLSDAQIDALEKKFHDQALEDVTDDTPASLAKRQRKRIERYIDNIEWTTGKLSPAQRELVRTQIATLPDTATSWYTYRDQQRQALIVLLRRGADSEQLRSFLTHWLADLQGLPVDLVQARTQLRTGLIQLIVKLDASLSETQRHHLEQRLMILSEDFQGLQQPQSKSIPGV